MDEKINKTHLLLFIIVLMVFLWSAFKPSSYGIWILEIIPAVIALGFITFLYKRFRLTTLSYTIIVLSTTLMFIGGHYEYSKVPLFDWLKDTLDLDRNHYDRFGHLMKGLTAIVIREILLRKTRLVNNYWLIGIVTSVILAVAALYEIIEWLFAMLTGEGKASKDFLGMQGDIWDAQWDMSLALAGSIFALLFFTRMHDRLLKREIGLDLDKKSD